jgi:hypothetical protein
MTDPKFVLGKVQEQKKTKTKTKIIANQKQIVCTYDLFFVTRSFFITFIALQY